MSKVRIYEVAKQLNMDQKSLVALFQSIGVGDVRNHMSAVEQDAVERVKRHIERQKTPDIVEERIRPTVVKRRAKIADTAVESVRAPAPSQRGVDVRPAPSSSMGAPPPAARPPAPSARIAAPAPPSRSAAEPSAPAAAPEAAPSRRSRTSTVGDPSARGANIARADLDFDTQAPVPAAPTQVEVTESAPQGTPEGERRRAPSSRGADAPPPVEAEAPRAAEATSQPVVEVSAPTPVETTDRDADRAPAARPSSRTSMQGSTNKLPPTQGQIASELVTPVEAAPPAPPIVEAPPAIAEPPRRPSSPPRTGIDVWQGRPGVPMPQARSAPPMARRTTYDPRAGTQPARTTASAMSGFPQGRMGGGPGNRNRPGFRRGPIGPSMPKRPAMPSPEMAAHKKVIKIEEQVSLQQLAAKMSLKVTDVLMRLLSMGMTGVNINSTIDADTAKILASEFGWTVEDVAVSEEATLEAAMGGVEEVADEDAEPRPPIVTVMGHVDHGKTSLLDRIRKASVASGEAGGITQHIGAYRVETDKGVAAFLDTPGHEAFTAMRARGAQVTDIVILVVAADDGVMPQTREAITHAQSAKVPIIVAVNKIDKPAADPERIKRDLANLGLQPEEWGGQTMFIMVSAVTGVGIDALLDAILLQSEVLELKASARRRASGVVIEALLDRGRGPVARVMVQDGTLKVGDTVIAGSAWGKVRAMTDEFGRALSSAGPSTPVEVLGLAEVPSAGDPVHAVKDARTAEEIAETRRKKNRSLIPADQRISLEGLKERLAEADQLELKLIIKGDVQGSVEAVAAALLKLTTPKVKVTLVAAAVGAITEGDVNLGIASKAIIIGFNVRPAGKATSAAETGGVEIRLYNIIYNAVDEVRAAMEGLLPTTKIEKELGKAEVRQVFKLSKMGVVAGCMVIAGVVRRSAEARVVRDGNVVHTGRIGSVRRVKDDVKEVAEGLECGISLESFSDVKMGDIIEAYEIEEVKQKLD